MTQTIVNSDVKTYNPATGEINKVYQKHSKEEVEQRIQASHKAFLNWRKTTLKERAETIQAIGKALQEHKAELSEIMTRQMGKPTSMAESEVDLCVAICEYTAQQGPEILAQEKRELEAGKAFISYEPLGVILGMQPWNFPCYQVVRYSISCIMAGNTTVLKHAEICWETAAKLKEIYESAGLPVDVFNVIYVDDETVDELISHHKFRGISFTGSAKAGKIVAKKAGSHLKKTVLELGGSDPYLVLDIKNLESIVESCVEGRINNTGQT